MTFGADADYTLEVSLDKEGEAVFQVLEDGNFSAVLYPSIDNADAEDEHWLLGPNAIAPYFWKIGKSDKDEATSGKSYLIRLVMTKLSDSLGRPRLSRPKRITWEAA